MVVAPDGSATSSVSGGCVESAVYDRAETVVSSDTPIPQRYGVADDDAFAVGLTCGGILAVYLEKVDRASFPELAKSPPTWTPAVQSLSSLRPNTWNLTTRTIAWIIRPDHDPSGSLGPAIADPAVHDDAPGVLAAGNSVALTYVPGNEGLRHRCPRQAREETRFFSEQQTVYTHTRAIT